MDSKTTLPYCTCLLYCTARPRTYNPRALLRQACRGQIQTERRVARITPSVLYLTARFAPKPTLTTSNASQCLFPHAPLSPNRGDDSVNSRHRLGQLAPTPAPSRATSRYCTVLRASSRQRLRRLASPPASARANAGALSGNACVSSRQRLAATCRGRTRSPKTSASARANACRAATSI